MSQQRKPKRQRQKEGTAARRQLMAEYVRRQRRNRRIVLTIVTVAVLGGGTAGAFFVVGGDEPLASSPSPSPGATPVPAGCSAAPDEEGAFDEPADQSLDPDKASIWRLETTKGTIDIELDVARAPLTANSIAFLTGEGFFDDLTFHRVVPGFVIQGGDPKGDGTGGPGYTCVEEPPSDLVYEEGIVAMAKTNAEPRGASGSQFFIVSGPEAANLPPDFALVGKVVAGMPVVEAIEATVPEPDDENPAPTPSETVKITKAGIV